MTTGYDDADLADVAVTVSTMLRSVASLWTARAQGGRLGGHSAPDMLKLAMSLENAARMIESGSREIAPGTELSVPLVASEDRFRRFVDSVVDYAIFMLDVDGRVASWNAGAERIKGYRAEEILGKHFSIFYPAEDVAQRKPEHELELALRSGRYSEEGWRLRKDGQPFWASVTIVAVRDAAGQLRGFGKVTRDLTERLTATEELRQSEERLRLMIEAVRDYAIFMLDPTGRITSWNIGAERLKGYRADEIIGKHFSIFYSEDDRKRGHPDEELRRAIEDGRYEEEGWRYRKDGTRFWANVLITALFDQEGRHIGFTKVTRDFTDARRLREAQVGMQVRDEFISVASHELRTPLAALLMHIESLRRTAQPDDSAPRLRVRLDKAAQAGQRLDALMNKMLDVSRMSAGHLDLEPEELLLDELVSEVVERFGDSAEIALRGATGVSGEWDRGRLDQVITNLFSNAVKYGQGKPIEVEISANEEEASVRVTDHGVGIAADHLDRIFEPFERAVRTRDFGGFGLGLWIARRIVQASGGHIEVESRPGEGATFTVRLPRFAAERKDAAHV